MMGTRSLARVEPGATQFRATLLVVDDEPEICTAVYHLLHARYTVLIAHSVAQGMALMAQHEVALVLTNQAIPELARVNQPVTLKTKYPEAIRMLYAGYTDLESMVEAVHEGHFHRFISKPWQPEELITAVDDAAREYYRIIQNFEELAKCRQTVKTLQVEVQTLRARLEI